MSKTVFSGAHRAVVDTLIEARKKAGLTQTELARRVGKDQSYVSLIERSQRRVDVLEFHALAKALEIDSIELFTTVVRRLPDDLEP
jgi:transcriptional regulator with XRE-family HTH domain